MTTKGKRARAVEVAVEASPVEVAVEASPVEVAVEASPVEVAVEAPPVEVAVLPEVRAAFVKKDSTPHEKVLGLEAVLHDELTVNGELLKVTKLYVGVYRNNKLIYLSPSFKGDSVAVLLKDIADSEAIQIFEEHLTKAGATPGAYRGTSTQVLKVIQALKKTALGVWG